MQVTNAQKTTSYIIALYGMLILGVHAYVLYFYFSHHLSLHVAETIIVSLLGFACLAAGHFMYRGRRAAFVLGFILSLTLIVRFALSFIQSSRFEVALSRYNSGFQASSIYDLTMLNEYSAGVISFLGAIVFLWQAVTLNKNLYPKTNYNNI